MNLVIDTNVVVSAIFWPGEARECLSLWAKRRFQLAVTLELLVEYREVAYRLGRKFRQVNPEPWLNWIEARAKVFEPVPLGKKRSRDPEDDPFLACALACDAKMIVSRDEDLLALGKPFGIQILQPRDFLRRMKGNALAGLRRGGRGG